MKKGQFNIRKELDEEKYKKKKLFWVYLSNLKKTKKKKYIVGVYEITY
jgi:hypothetical protein